MSPSSRPPPIAARAADSAHPAVVAVEASTIMVSALPSAPVAQRPSKDRLERLAEDVGYEVQTLAEQLVAYCELIVRPNAQRASTLEAQAGVVVAIHEAPLLHLRNLHEFLTLNVNASRGAVVARHYLDSWGGDDTKPQPLRPEWTWGRLHQFLAHVSAQRKADLEWPAIDEPPSPFEDYQWPRLQMAKSIAAGLGEFLDALDDEQPERRAWFGRAAAGCAAINGI